MFYCTKRFTAILMVVAMTCIGAGTAFAEENKNPGTTSGTENTQAANNAEGQTAFQGSPTVHYSALPNETEVWPEDAMDGEATKTIGPVAKTLQSIRVGVDHVSGGVQYRVYLNQGGWQEWKADNEPTTAPAEDIQIEAVQMKLTGEISNFLDIYYCTDISDDGQLDWAKNGEIAGTMALGKYIKELKVKLIAKIDPAPGPTDRPLVAPYQDGLQYVDSVLRYMEPDGTAFTGWTDVEGNRYYINDSYAVLGWQYLDGYKLYFAEDGKLVQNLESIIGAQSEYLLKLNKQMNCLTVYAKDGNNGFIIPVKSMLCSTGADTPIGTSKTNEKYRWHLMNGGVYTQYATRIIPGTGYMVHSVIYEKPNNKTLRTDTYNYLGIARSAGCVRLTSADSKWIYDNCKLGTTVTIYNSPIPGPYYRPTVVQIPSNQKWDPTDVTVTQ